jgi:hypothetical protein
VAELQTHRLARAHVLVPLALRVALNNLSSTHDEVCAVKLMTATAKAAIEDTKFAGLRYDNAVWKHG